MNRRRFLSFLSVAPVALPMAAHAMAAKPQVFIGVDGASKGDLSAAILSYEGKPLRSWLIANREGLLTPNEVRDLMGLARLDDLSEGRALA